MKSVCLRLILCLVSLLEALAQQNIYIDAASTQGNGTSGSPYPDLNTALTGIQSQSAGAYILSIRESSSFYSIENNYTLTGSNITFQNWGSVPQTNIISPSSQSCSNMPQVGIVGGGIIANSISFNGVQFVTANNTNTSLSLTVTQLSISNSCFDIDFVSNSSQEALENTTVTGTLEDPPTGLEDEYLLLIQGDGTNNSAVTLTNIFIGGALSIPPLISAANIETLQLTNIVATSFPQIDAVTESTSINGFTVNGSGQNQTQTLATTETKPCWTKIAYSSQMSFEDIQITQLNITENASFFCVYQIQDTDSSDDSDEQGFTVNNLNFEYNNLNTGIDWCLIYSTLDDNIDVVSRNTTITNINVINNTVSTANDVNSMLIFLLFTGDIGISNVTFVNNTHFKFLDASPENTELSSNLDTFENALFSNNIWDLGGHPIISVTINPIIELDLPVVPTTTVSNLTVASNLFSKNFFYFENEQIEDEYERYYLTPRATFQNISLIDNEISGSTVFTIQMFNLDFTDLTITGNNLTSSNILQSSAGCSPLQLMNITVENTILSDSNIIYKQFDTSEIVENMDTDYNDNPTSIPYTVYISGFNVKNSSFFEYSTGFKIKAAPLLFIEGCEFENLSFTSSSMLFAISDLLSLLSNIIFDADTVLDFGYTSYLVGIDNDNLISLFEESIPIDEGDNSPFQLGYAIDHLTNGLIFIYRITECNFQNILLNQADLIDITTVSLNQSLVTIDSNTFSNITLVSFQDTLVRANTIQVFNFAYNEISQFAGAGATLTSNQVSYLSVTNNYVHDNIGSSFLQMTSDINLDTFIGNNIVNNITSVTTFISLQISSNAGLVLFQNNSFNNCYVVADPEVYRQLNFISIDNEFSIRPITSPPDFYVNECNFTNMVIYKNHPLIKQYQNSFFVANLADDTFLVENSLFDNISIQYTHNLLVVITEVFQLYNTTISNIENYDTTGSVYTLATSVTINNVSFINNTALEGNGAALYLDYDSIVDAQVDVTLENCLFQNNIAAQGSIIYYTTKAINLTASNNLFIDNQVSQDSGSFVYFFNVTFTGLSFSQNQIITTKTSSNYFVFFYFDTVKTQANTSLYINDLAVNLSASVSGIIFSVEESNVNFIFDNLTIFNSTLTTEPTNELTIMNIESGQVLLKNSSIYNLSSNVRSLIEILCVKEYNSFLRIDGTQFSAFSLQHNPDFLMYTKDYTYTGIVHLSNRGGKLNCNNTLLITDTTFNDLNFDIQNTPLIDPSTVILDYNGVANLTIESTTFQNLFSEFGPAINLASSSNLMNTTVINSNTFTNTTSYLEGGAIFNSQNNLSLTSNQFTNCQSQQRSGAVLFSQTILNFSDILSSNTFINTTRYADYDFQDNNPIGTLPTLLNLTFFTPSYISQNMTNQSIFLGNFSGYDLENVNISAILIDALNQTVYDTSATANDPKQLSLEVLGKFSESRDCDDSTCILVEPNLPIKGNSSEIIEGQVTYSSPEFDISSEYFKMDLRACLNGELDAKVTGDYSGPQCFPCLSGTYALNVSIDTECLGCPEHATCMGGNDIVIDAGYWRPNTSTVQILECRTSSACLGGFGSTCLEGRDGFLCDACDTAEKWVKDKNECTLCPSAEKSLLVFILVLLLTFGYQLWYIKAARISNSYLIASSGNAFDTEAGRKIELKITQGMYIRQLTTYSQIFAIITTFNIDFLSLFGSFEAVTETLANPTVALFQSSTCGLIDVGITDERLLYLRILFVTVSPIVKWLLIAAFRLIHWKFQITEKRVSILLITAICLFLLEQPSIAQQLFTYLSCIQIDGDSNYYLQSDIAYQCYTPDYYLFRNFVVIPGLLFYIGAVPIFLIFVLRKNRKNINDEKLRMNLGAMYNEYTPKAFYWGIILMATKLILIFLGSILDSDVKTKALSIFIVLYIYYALSLQVQPYFRKELYRAERIAFIAYLITVFGSIYYKDNSLGWVQWVILVTITLLNIYVIAMLVWQICKVYLYQSRDIILPLLKRFRGEQSVDIDFSNDDDLNDLDEHSLEKIEERIFKNNGSTNEVNSSKDEESFSPKE